MSKKFSILICSIFEREKLLQRLIAELNEQISKHKFHDAIEILIQSDNKEKTTGYKRNDLLSRATGDYIAFIDDDDMVSSDYIEKHLIAIDSNPDVCSLEGIIYTNMKDPKTFIHSLEYSTWFEKNGIYYRNPNHLNCVKRDIALRVKFPNLITQEDRHYSIRLLPYLKTEAIIPCPIYFYYYDSMKNINQRTRKDR